MTIAWPAFLPLPQRQGHAYTPADLVQRSEMEGGPVRARQKFSAGPTPFTIGFVLDSTQWPLFEAFYAYDLQQGSAEFFLPVNSGTGVIQRRARFIGAPSYDTSLGAMRCSVTASVQVVESLPMTKSDYLVLSITPGFLAGEDVLDRITNTLYPRFI